MILHDFGVFLRNNINNIDKLVYNINNGYMDINTLYVVLAVPCFIILYVVYEMIKMGSARKGYMATHVHTDSQTFRIEPTLYLRTNSNS